MEDLIIASWSLTLEPISYTAQERLNLLKFRAGSPSKLSLSGPGMPGVIEGGEGGAIIMLYFSTYSLWRMQQHVWRRFCNATQQSTAVR